MARGSLAALVLVLILAAVPVLGQTRDAADYWPNYPMAVGHVLTPDPACPVYTTGAGTTWAFELWAPPTPGGMTFRTWRSGGASGTPWGSGTAIQDWAWTPEKLYVLGEIGCTPLRCDLVQTAPPWPLTRRYFTPSSHYQDQAYLTTTTVTGFDPTYQTPPQSAEVAIGMATVTVRAGLADHACGGALAHQIVPTGYGREEVWISDYVPICGTTDYRRGMVRWKATATIFTVAQCAAAGGRWQGPYETAGECALADAALCWRPNAREMGHRTVPGFR